MESGEGDDILRGRAGDERSDAGDLGDVAMFGYLGDDKLYGGTGDDAMEGDEGTDEHYGGPDNDFIDAAIFESVDTPDLVNGGDGYDVCIVNENDDPSRELRENRDRTRPHSGDRGRRQVGSAGNSLQPQ